MYTLNQGLRRAKTLGRKARLDITEDLEQEARLAAFLGRDPVDAVRVAYKHWQFETNHPERFKVTPVLLPILTEQIDYSGKTTNDHMESLIAAHEIMPDVYRAYTTDLMKYPMRHRISLKSHW